VAIIEKLNVIIQRDKSMEKELFVTKKNVWGNDKLYPDCETSKFFTQIHGTKIVTEQLEAILRASGYTFSTRGQQI
tara:strand:+ start:308 stop:535 length:228 start_codon:yes stop_codon:yes gene_type:complete